MTNYFLSTNYTNLHETQAFDYKINNKSVFSTFELIRVIRGQNTFETVA
jgi:hypothetical protein